MTDEPRSLGEALAAGEEERVQTSSERQGELADETTSAGHADPPLTPEQEEENWLPEHNESDAPGPSVTLDDVRKFFVGEQAEEPPSVEVAGSAASTGTPESEPARQPASPAEDDLADEQHEAPPQGDHEPTLADLRALLTSREFAASVPVSEFGPLVSYGDRQVPKALLDLWRAGWLRDWPG